VAARKRAILMAVEIAYAGIFTYSLREILFRKARNPAAQRSISGGWIDMNQSFLPGVGFLENINVLCGNQTQPGACLLAA